MEKPNRHNQVQFGQIRIVDHQEPFQTSLTIFWFRDKKWKLRFIHICYDNWKVMRRLHSQTIVDMWVFWKFYRLYFYKNTEISTPLITRSVCSIDIEIWRNFRNNFSRTLLFKHYKISIGTCALVKITCECKNTE